MILFSFISLVLSVIFVMPLMFQPLSLGGWIMIMALFCTLMMGLDCNSWFGYVLFLMYVGGLLVMFAYVAALTPNLIFYGLGAVKLVLLITLVFLGMVFSTYIPFIKTVNVDLSSMGEFFEGYSGMLVVIYNISIFISLSIILFLALVAVVKICYFQDGPLRSFK
uniref:NADH dehydrogenase subunit 6 n=1 Tax=Ennucula tenuis TaxID=106224 RepID=UPI00286C7F14|nr:NADH dehydrogenase subunit 6 [Ennucula tenuis]WLV28174.1 NADH dehydrogenase subunit 6 [Ennucula tenuis]